MSEGKGKEKVIDLTDHEQQEESDDSTSSGSDTSSASDSDSDASSQEIPRLTKETLDLLIEKACGGAQGTSEAIKEDVVDEEEEIKITTDTLPPLPRLNPGFSTSPYITLGKGRRDGPSSIRIPDVEYAEKALASMSVPAPPLPPPELSKSGKQLTKREKKEMHKKTAGPDWFNLPAPAESDLPRLYREVESLRLRNQLDPKRFYRKEEGEGKGIKGLPKFFAIGTVVNTSTPFGTPTADNLTRAERKRTLVDELVDDDEAKRYAKKKFDELQSVRGAKGKKTLHAKRALRQSKW